MPLNRLPTGPVQYGLVPPLSLHSNVVCRSACSNRQSSVFPNTRLTSEDDSIDLQGYSDATPW